MDNTFNPGARVMSSTGEEIGIVDRVVEFDSGEPPLLIVNSGDSTVEVPLELVDAQRSMADAVVLTVPFDRAPTPPRTIQVHAEDAQIDVYDVELGRVVVEKTIERVPIRQDIALGTDNVEIRRVPVGEEYDVRPESRQDGEILIVPVVEEVLVLTRRYRLVEEIHVITRRDRHIEQVEVELQREVVTVREELNDGSVREL